MPLISKTCQRKLTVAYLFLTLSSSIIAGEPVMQPPNERVGAYAEVDLGRFKLDASYSVCSFTGGTSGGCYSVDRTEWGTAAEAILGYMILPYFGLEIGAMYLKEDHGAATVSPTAAARFHIPIGERFKFVTKLGAMIPNHHGGSTSATLFYNFGASYSLTQSIDLNIKYKSFYTNQNNQFVTLGLTYHF